LYKFLESFRIIDNFTFRIDDLARFFTFILFERCRILKWFIPRIWMFFSERSINFMWVFKRITWNTLIFFVEETIVGLKMNTCRSIILYFFIFLLLFTIASSILLIESSKEGLKIPICHFLNFTDHFCDLFPMLQTFFMLLTACFE
jgi:hypothetical protein